MKSLKKRSYEELQEDLRQLEDENSPATVTERRRLLRAIHRKEIKARTRMSTQDWMDNVHWNQSQARARRAQKDQES